jgi:phage FluMu protein Com
MGRRNPSRVFGGRIVGAEMRADSAKKEAAAKLREAAAEICQAWNYRMIGFGGPVQPSPTIADAIAGGFYYLEVKCRRCSTHSIVDLTAVNQVRRKPDTPIWKLEASLRCRHCSEALRGRRAAANIARLRKENTLEFEPWYPEDER